MSFLVTGGGGGLKLIERQKITSLVSAVDFLDIPAGFSGIRFFLEGVVSTAAGYYLEAVVSSNNGASWASAGYTGQSHFLQGAYTPSYVDFSSAIRLGVRPVTTCGGFLEFFNHGSVNPTSFQGVVSTRYAADPAYASIIGGVLASSIHNGVRFYVSSGGQLYSGAISLWGIK